MSELEQALQRMRDAVAQQVEADAAKAAADAVVAKTKEENQRLIDQARAERERLATQPNDLALPEIKRRRKELSALILALEGPAQAFSRPPDARTSMRIVPAGTKAEG